MRANLSHVNSLISDILAFVVLLFALLLFFLLFCIK
jgi:hypothetical protein